MNERTVFTIFRKFDIVGHDIVMKLSEKFEIKFYINGVSCILNKQLNNPKQFLLKKY